jgi:hypothetical protein
MKRHIREGRSIATLVVVMVAAFLCYFVVTLANPVLPPYVHEAVALAPSVKGNRHEALCRDRGVALFDRRIVSPRRDLDAAA